MCSIAAVSFTIKWLSFVVRILMTGALSAVNKNELGKRLPRITTSVPGPKSMEVRSIMEENEPTYITSGGLDKIVWKEAIGCNVVDIDDNIFLDLSSGSGTTFTGHRNPEIVNAIKRQADLSLQTESATLPRIELGRLLTRIIGSPLSKVAFESHNSVAVEMALMVASAYKQSSEFISFYGGFHGKTMGTLRVTSNRKYRAPFQPILGTAHHFPYPYPYRFLYADNGLDCGQFHLDLLENYLRDPATGAISPAAIIVEPIQGHEGTIVPPDNFLTGLRKLCDEYDVLLIFDEIMTGFGRTGKMFCFEHFGIKPDLITLGKGLSSSLPLSATIGRKEVMESLTHDSTFMANPVCCAAGLASINYTIRNHLPDRAEKMGQYTMDLLRDLCGKQPFFGDLRGKGLMIGLELVGNKDTKKPLGKEMASIRKELFRRGILMNIGGQFGNVLKIEPPLIIEQDQIDFAGQSISDAIRAATQ